MNIAMADGFVPPLIDVDIRRLIQGIFRSSRKSHRAYFAHLVNPPFLRNVCSPGLLDDDSYAGEVRGPGKGSRSRSLAVVTRRVRTGKEAPGDLYGSLVRIPIGPR